MAELDNAQTTPEEEAPLDLDSIMREQRTIRSDAADAAGPDAHEDNDPAEDPALEDQEHPEDFGNRREDADTPPPPDEEPEPHRFKSHEEAEKGYKNLQGKLTRIEQKLAAIEKGEQTRSQKEAEERKARTQAEAETKLNDFAIKRNREMLDEIDGLDPDAPDYRDQAAKLQAKAWMDIRQFERSMQTEAPPEENSPTSPAEGGEPPPPDFEAKSAVEQALKAAKIKPDDPVFAHYARHVPTQDPDGRPLTLDEQVQKAITWTNNYRASQKKQYRQQIEQPLDRANAGRRGSGGNKSEKIDTEAFTLSDALDAAQRRRTVGR